MEPHSYPRMHWVDLVKGISVVLVVLMHASLTLPQVAGASGIATLWNAAGNILEPLRMPVFFLVSGMLAASAVNRGWDRNRQRTWGIGYLYVLWTVILLAVTTLFLQQQGPIEAVASLPTTLTFAASGYWYLYALVLFFVIAAATRRLPPLLVVGAAAMLNVLRPQTGEVLAAVLAPLHPGSLAPTMAMNLVFFLVGVHYRELARKVSLLAGWPAVTLLGVALIGAGVYRLLTPQLWGYTFLPLSIGWIIWAIMAAHLATGSPRIRRMGSYLGARTLPIYVVQFPLLYVISATLERTQLPILANPVVQLLYPLVLTALIAATALLLHRAVQGGGLRYLFTAPAWALNPTASLRRAAAVQIPAQGPVADRTPVPAPAAAAEYAHP